MGHKLVGNAYTFVSAFNERARSDGGRQLEPLEVALLVLMAHSARDTDRSPSYFGSRSATCAALGIADTEPGRKRVQRAVRALVGAEAITRAKNVHRGFTPVHRLIYQGGALMSTFLQGESEDQPVPNADPKVDASAPPSDQEGGRLSTGRWTFAHGKVDASAPPYKEIGITRRGENTQPTDLPAPKATCRRHEHWKHDDACRACGIDRLAYQKWETEIGNALQQVRANTPPTLAQLTTTERAQIDSAVRGFTTVAPRLQPALEEAKRERDAA